MTNSDEWELVGGVYRRKPKPDNSGVWVLIVGAFIVLAMLGQCAG